MPREEEELTIEDEVEELDISDDETEGEAEGEEKPDRGDVVAPDPEPEAESDDDELDTEDSADSSEDSEDSEDVDEDGAEDGGDGDSPGPVPYSRFSENVKAKNDALEENVLLRAELLRRDKEALAAEEDKATGQHDEGIAAQEAVTKESLDDLWADYGEKTEMGEFDEAREILTQINIAQEKITRKIVTEQIEAAENERRFNESKKAAVETARELKERYPELLETESAAYEQFTILADGLYAAGRDMSKALEMAAKAMFGEGKKTAVSEDDADTDPKKETAADRKRAAILRNAKAAGQQPAPLDKGIGHGQKTALAKKKIKDMTEEEFDDLDDKDKDRGDKVL